MFGLSMLKKGAPSGPESPVSYYFDSWTDAPSNSNWANQDNMVDGDIDTDANASHFIAVAFDIILDSNTCPGDDLGTITKVEIRAHGNEASQSGIFSWYIDPIFVAGGGNGGNLDAENLSNEWSQWFDITSAYNAPGTPEDPGAWEWSDVVALQIENRLTYSGSGPLNNCLTSKVEVRVTFS